MRPPAVALSGPRVAHELVEVPIAVFGEPGFDLVVGERGREVRSPSVAYAEEVTAANYGRSSQVRVGRSLYFHKKPLADQYRVIL